GMQAQAALAKGSPDALALGVMLADDAPNIGIREEDEDYWLKLREAAQAQLDARDPRVMRIRFVLGLLLASRGEYPEALRELQDVAQVQSMAPLEDAHFTLEVLGALAGVYMDVGELATAE